jgi:hypothetical protein
MNLKSYKPAFPDLHVFLFRARSLSVFGLHQNQPIANIQTLCSHLTWKRMKVLIHDDETGLYLGHQERWTDDPHSARDFAFSVHAAAVGRNMGLKRFQIFFFFAEINYKIAVYNSQCSEAA